MLDLTEVSLTVDESEAIRLADLLGYAHEEGGREMGVSRATFGRILKKARRVVADAIINGKAINIQGGHYEMVVKDRVFKCISCGYEWNEAPGTGRPANCPQCKAEELERIYD